MSGGLYLALLGSQAAIYYPLETWLSHSLLSFQQGKRQFAFSSKKWHLHHFRVIFRLALLLVFNVEIIVIIRYFQLFPLLSLPITNRSNLVC